MRQRTVAQHALHRAANALTGDRQTTNRIVATVTDPDLFLADPRAWLTADRAVTFKCESATETAHIEHHGIHTVTLTGHEPVLADHPHLGDTELEALLAAMGGPAPTCLVLAAATTTEGAVLPGHENRFTGVTRTPLLTVRYLSAARAWLTHNPDTDLPAMLPVLHAGITPHGWQAWTQAGFTPKTAAPFLSRGVHLTAASAWLHEGMGTGRAAALAASGIHASAVTDLIAAGLTKTVAQRWVSLARDLTADQISALHARQFHPSEAADAIKQVGYDIALAYGDAGLITGAKVRTNNTWWNNFGDHVQGAFEWATRTGLDPCNAGWLVDLRNADLADEDQSLSPDWVLDWYEHGVTTMEELAELAPLSYHPCELDGAPRPVDPHGRPIRYTEALWLWRATDENVEPWIAASTGTPEWDDNGTYIATCPNCPITDDGPTRCAHEPVPALTAVPQIRDNPHQGDLYYCRTRQVLVEAMAEAADEGFPEHALPALAAHGPVTAARWEYATSLVHVLNDDEFVPFLTSPVANPNEGHRLALAADAAKRQVVAWRESLTSATPIAA